MRCVIRHQYSSVCCTNIIPHGCSVIKCVVNITFTCSDSSHKWDVCVWSSSSTLSARSSSGGWLLTSLLSRPEPSCIHIQTMVPDQGECAEHETCEPWDCVGLVSSWQWRKYNLCYTLERVHLQCWVIDMQPTSFSSALSAFVCGQFRESSCALVPSEPATGAAFNRAIRLG